MICDMSEIGTMDMLLEAYIIPSVWVLWCLLVMYEGGYNVEDFIVIAKCRCPYTACRADGDC